MRINIKYLLLIGLLCVGLTTLARATVTQIGFNVDLPNSGEQAELDGFIAAGGDADATLCFKSDQDNPDFHGIIQFSVNADDTLHVEWDMTGTGQLICGFGTKDGDGTIEDFFSVAPDQGNKGEGDLAVPGNGADSLSHLTAFCCEGGGGVPDSGTTAMLLGGALASLGVVRRYLKS
jgi:hypothetical protein